MASKMPIHDFLYLCFKRQHSSIHFCQRGPSSVKNMARQGPTQLKRDIWAALFRSEGRHSTLVSNAVFSVIWPSSMMVFVNNIESPLVPCIAHCMDVTKLSCSA